MTFLGILGKVAEGAAIGVATVTALPVFGAVGTITAAGVVVGTTIGAAAAVVDEIKKS